jgi:predicted DNA-binding transcriptional regulator YafY
MNRTERLYAIVEELRAAAPRGRTAEWLARHFEVASRTIKRDVSALQQGGAPIWATGGPGGGYALDATIALPPLTFTAGEAAAIAAALGASAQGPFAPDARSALTKVLGAMTAEGRAEATDLAERIWVRPAKDVRSSQVRAVEEALRDRLVVVLDYVDASGHHSEKRPVEPMVFAQNGGRWYLLAWCRRRRAGRWFRLDRITGAWPTREPFELRDLVAVFGEPPEDAYPVVSG